MLLFDINFVKYHDNYIKKPGKQERKRANLRVQREKASYTGENPALGIFPKATIYAKIAFYKNQEGEIALIVTTAGRTNEEMIEKAMQTAKELGLRYIERGKRTVKGMKERYAEDILVVGKERLELFSTDSNEPFFFHPNSASFRLKRIMKGEEDSFVEAAGLAAGMSLLDCTMGMASDAIVASHVVGGEGRITGIEASRADFLYSRKGTEILGFRTGRNE